MKRKILHSAVYKDLLLLLLSWFISLNAQDMKPQIYSLEKDYDFGDIVEGSIVTHDFEIVNDGDAPLELYKINSSCGCTIANPEKNILQPGKSTIIKVAFNSSDRSGRQKKYINIFSNDPENKYYRLAIYANVLSEEEASKSNIAKPLIWVEDTKHNFGTAKEGTVLTWDFKIRNDGDTTLVITDVQTSCGCTAALLSNDELGPEEVGNIKVELDTSGMKGMKSRTIAILSNDPFHPRTVITLFVTVEE